MNDAFVDGLILNLAKVNNVIVNNYTSTNPIKGTPPIGSIVATMTDIGSSVVNGWKKCDGSVVPSGNILAGVTLPSLLTDVFLLGYTTVGVYNTSSTFTSTSFPPHTHSTDTPAVGGGDHAHTISGGTGVARDHAHTIDLSENNKAEFGTSFGNTAAFSTFFNGTYTSSFAGYGALCNTYYGSEANGFSHNSYVAGSLTAYASVMTYQVVAGEGSHSHIFSGNTDDGGSGTETTFDVTPQFITTFFIMRVN